MRLNLLLNAMIAAGAGAAVAAALVVTAARARGADPRQPAAGPSVPSGHVLVDARELQTLVHNEVERQMLDYAAQGREAQLQRGQPSRQPSVVARARSLRSIAQTVRSQVILYRLQYNDACPTLRQMANGFEQLRLRTDSSGEAVAPGHASGGGVYGPYLSAAPDNPFTGKTRVVAAGKPSADAGWTYDPATGAVKGVVSREVAQQITDADAIHDIEVAGAN
jgi:hypothetical protein